MASSPTADAPPSERSNLLGDGKGQSWFSEFHMLLLILFLQIFTNADQGFIANCLIKIQEDVGLSYFQAGIVSSMHYLGIMLVSAFGGFLLGKFSGYIRPILVGSFLLNGLVLISTYFASGFFSLCVVRVLVGITHAIGFVYYPVWINVYAPEGQATTWMGFMVAMSSVSTILSYAVSGWLVHGNDVSWRLLFVVQALFVLACTAVIQFLVPADLLLTHNPKAPKPAETTALDLGFKESLMALLRQPLFWLVGQALCALYFVITSANYFSMPVLVKQFGITPSEATLAVSLVGATGPVMGILLGGTLFDKLSGGYKNTAEALKVSFYLSLLVNLALPWIMIFVEETIVGLSIALWFAFFFGGVLVPVFLGIIIDCVDESLQTFASGLFNVISNGEGYFLGPFLTGLMMDLLGELGGWRFIFAWWEFAVVFSGAAWLVAREQKKTELGPAPAISA